MSTDNKVFASTGWAFAAECAAKIVVPVTNMILARILAPEVFGIVVTINMVISFAEVFTGAGFQKYLIQHDFESDESLNRASDIAFWVNFGISIIALTFIGLFNESIASLVGSEGYGIAIVVASLSLPLQSLSCIYEGLNQRKFNFRLLFIIRVMVCFVPLFVTVPLALAGLGYWALIMGTLSGNLLKDVVYICYKRQWFPSLYFNFEEFKAMFSFGIWTLLEAIVSWSITWVDVFLISSSLNAYYTGLYKTAQNTVTSILSIITASIQPVFFSMLSRCKNDSGLFKDNYLSFVRFSAIFLVPAGVGMLAYSDFITLILLGKQWMEASQFIGLWSLSIALVCLFGELNREAYRAIGRPNISFYVLLSNLLVVIPVCFIAVRGGYHSLTIARPLAHLEVIIVHLICTKFLLKIDLSLYFRNIIWPFVSAFVMFGCSMLLKRCFASSLIVDLGGILICIVVYFSILCISGKYRKLVFGLINDFIHRNNAK